jgi:hypothetical protein
MYSNLRCLCITDLSDHDDVRIRLEVSVYVYDIAMLKFADEECPIFDSTLITPVYGL